MHEKITFNLTFPSGKQQIEKFSISDAIKIGAEPVYIGDTLYNVSEYDKKTLQNHINKCWETLTARRLYDLNGDMANQFNEMDIW
jgi:hypothetical protein